VITQRDEAIASWLAQMGHAIARSAPALADRMAIWVPMCDSLTLNPEREGRAARDYNP
jgi:hypothetical protein